MTEILKEKEYITIGGFMRGVRSCFEKIFGSTDFLTLEEHGRAPIEEIIRNGENSVYSEGSKELRYKLGWDIEFPDRIYVYYEDLEKDGIE